MKNLMTFQDQVALITGASSGIGQKIAIDLAARGATVVGCARSHPGLQATLSEVRRVSPASAIYLCDVSDAQQVRQMAEKVLSNFGKIDILINNAGVGTYGSFVESTADSIESVLRTNFFGAAYCIKEVLPSMMERRSGHIVNIASVAGKIGSPNMASYCASKFALIGLSESLYHELKPLGIHVSVINPGQVRTQMPLLLQQRDGGVRLPGFLILKTEAVSRAVIRSVEKQRFEVVVPPWLATICLLKAIFPNLFRRLSDYAFRLRLSRGSKRMEA